MGMELRGYSTEKTDKESGKCPLLSLILHFHDDAPMANWHKVGPTLWNLLLYLQVLKMSVTI